jgi:hypothetical protein
MKKILLMLMVVMSMIATTNCKQEADTASYNLSIAADNFQIERRIVFIDTWTDTYLLSITGLCSIKSASGTTGSNGVAVTCKTGQNDYKKHYLGLSGNVTYFSEQIREAPVNVYHYKVVFRPSTIIPDIEIR